MFCTCKWKPVHRFDSKCTTSSSWSATQLNSFFTLKIINFHLRKVYCPHLVWDISDHSYIPQQKCLFTVVFVSFTKFCPYCSKPRSRSGPQKQVHCLHCHRERVCVCLHAGANVSGCNMPTCFGDYCHSEQVTVSLTLFK